ncbi:amidohydrolase [Flexivirga caeni]|uniref:Amidohydrolase n=1 Tax=Flexivirga caeni TaxID=2294115 RepID=A0A3M9MGN2_9MICO|nr:amidohydrolase [Flexivirga caeni]RNI24720.1 amidohydrolase [Flexivirga caeni]
MSADEGTGLLDGVELIDHHCHGIVRTDLDRDGFESMLCEADGPGRWHGSLFDTHAGLGVRRWCAPLLGLPSLAPADDYLARRRQLGVDEVNRRLIGSLATRKFLVDTGFQPEALTSPAELSAVTGAVGEEIVRLEQVAEQVVRTSDAARFADDFRTELSRRCAGAVGVKSVAAYRVGLRLDAARPTDAEVAAAAGRLLRAFESGEPARVADPVLTRFLIWSGADLGMPIQFHVGYGDADVNLADCDPLLLTPLLRALGKLDVPVMLLHNYPFHRHAGYLAQVFDHVFVDVGLTLHNVGPGAPRVLSELLELAPFGSVLFSSDAFGLPELYVVGTMVFRRSLTGYLEAGIADGAWTSEDAMRFATGICAANARRAYRLDAS